MENPKPIKLTVTSAKLEDVFTDIARLHFDHRPNAKAGQILQLNVAGKKVYAVARGPRQGTEKHEIALESALRERLGVKTGQEYDFTIDAAGFWGSLCWAWHSSDAMPRIAARLGLTSVFLGFIGLVLGIISLWA